MSPTVRLNPSIPACWESPEVLRFGYEQPLARVIHPSIHAERLLQRLRRGLVIDTAARTWGDIPRDEWGSLIAALTPVLIEIDSEAVVRESPALLLHGDPMFSEALGERLQRMGCRTVSPMEASLMRWQQVCVISTSSYVRERSCAHLDASGQQLPELHVRITDQSVWIGPFVAPGGSPCARCALLHERDADPVRPLLAAQLIDRPIDLPSDDALWRIAGLIYALLSRHEMQAEFAHTQMRCAIRDGVLALTPELLELRTHPECACAAGS